jgi:hypothetical protein
VTLKARLVAFSGAALAAAMAAASPFPHLTIPPQQGTPPDTGRPAITLLYQNFPNPFPSTTSTTTCIWFDLDRTTAVSLTIHDVRGNLVRTLLPNASSPQYLKPGRYGRASASGSGCDPSFTWDGTAANGSPVPRGVYLIRLRAGGVQSIKKAVYQGS